MPRRKFTCTYFLWPQRAELVNADAHLRRLGKIARRMESRPLAEIPNPPIERVPGADSLQHRAKTAMIEPARTPRVLRIAFDVDRPPDAVFLPVDVQPRRRARRRAEHVPRLVRAPIFVVGLEWRLRELMYFDVHPGPADDAILQLVRRDAQPRRPDRDVLLHIGRFPY